MDDRKPISVARLARDTTKIMEEISSKGAMYYVTRPGGRSAVLLINEDHFETLRGQLEIERNPRLRALLEQSRRDLAAGLGRDLEEVAREMGLDRPQPRRRRTAQRSSRASRKAGTRRTAHSRRRAA